ncbi:uncharacterized protein IWZ02DRAFT_459897 [Phyllosticta citriasiana]|uniref:uncharacterized protein n=1 Tax=Phyllosticta citriasiana TaxID=595635 RepID=UPI0030FD7288
MVCVRASRRPSLAAHVGAGQNRPVWWWGNLQKDRMTTKKERRREIRKSRKIWFETPPVFLPPFHFCGKTLSRRKEVKKRLLACTCFHSLSISPVVILAKEEKRKGKARPHQKSKSKVPEKQGAGQRGCLLCTRILGAHLVSIKVGGEGKTRAVRLCRFFEKRRHTTEKVGERKQTNQVCNTRRRVLLAKRVGAPRDQCFLQLR